MRILKEICAFIFLCVITGYKDHPGTIGYSSSSYNLNSPDKISILPPGLFEISGITIVDPKTIAVINDENGILFIYDLAEEKIKKQILFGGNGDYEDITRVENTIYVLRSDGTIFEISDYSSKTIKISTFKTGVPSNDSEGLCYEPNTAKLLIGCKADIKKENFKKKRAVFSFNIRTKKLDPDPSLILNINTIETFISENNIKLKKQNYSEGKPDIKFRISAINIHPKTRKIYILSAEDYLLFVVSSDGKINSIESLDRKMFNQAEGLAFLENGDMLISNEGRNEKPTLLRFKYNNTP